ncbi:glycosyltransferase family 2 protein [Dokdonia sinensis]|uniref:Glycosyltransferase family 2 protein n=1 Tax=Dokdonia sinensis TaxID=2479847 RepID=A0A3M0GJE9_9FLAO|nr:glycosyltransferase family A protein [Dokdonia sinensis]RMB57426.1 glycosyltransferase family 2 protein [Dokdonia sinensis]
MTTPLISIIVPCYKQAHFLKESLQSVLKQTYGHWECIIVNDGSPDNTGQVANDWCKKDDRFKYVSKDNGGLSSARNAGIKASNGTFILPLDADDLLHKRYLEYTVPVLYKNNELAIVTTYSTFFEGSLENVIHQLRPQGDTYPYLLYVNQLVATSLYRKKCWDEVGGYDETMKKGFEDWEFWLAVTKRGWKYKVLEEPLFYYRKAKKSMLVTTISRDAERVKEYIIHKHRDIYIEDFDNCIKVFTHYLTTSRKKEQCLQNSLEYRLGKIILKPYRILERILNKK